MKQKKYMKKIKHDIRCQGLVVTIYGGKKYERTIYKFDD